MGCVLKKYNWFEFLYKCIAFRMGRRVAIGRMPEPGSRQSCLQEVNRRAIPDGRPGCAVLSGPRQRGLVAHEFGRFPGSG